MAYSVVGPPVALRGDARPPESHPRFRLRGADGL